MADPERPYGLEVPETLTDPALEVLKALRDGDGIVREIFEDWPHIREWPEVLIWIMGGPTAPDAYAPLDTELAKIGWRRGTQFYSQPEGSRFTQPEVWVENWSIVPASDAAAGMDYERPKDPWGDDKDSEEADLERL